MLKIREIVPPLIEPTKKKESRKIPMATIRKEAGGVTEEPEDEETH